MALSHILRWLSNNDKINTIKRNKHGEKHQFRYKKRVLFRACWNTIVIQDLFFDNKKWSLCYCPSKSVVPKKIPIRLADSLVLFLLFSIVARKVLVKFNMIISYIFFLGLYFFILCTVFYLELVFAIELNLTNNITCCVTIIVQSQLFSFGPSWFINDFLFYICYS